MPRIAAESALLHRNSPEQIRGVLADLRRQWFAGEFEVRAKKELLRCVIAEVCLTTRGKVVRAEVVWQGGARSELDVAKYMGAPTEAYHRIFELAKTHTDAEIPDALNA